MSKPIWALGYEQQEAQGDEMSAVAYAQASDAYILETAKELLVKLWLADRITLEARTVGEAALAVAVHATEFPGLRKIGVEQGKSLTEKQWLSKQRRDDHGF